MSSRPLHDIVDEVQRLVSSGHQEIVLTGIHLGHYGVDWNRNKPKQDWIRLSHLLRELLTIDGDFRVRLSSIEATEVTRELIRIMADHGDTFCPHLHICLQSGSDSVLRRMKRRGGVKRFLDRCDVVRKALDEPALTTDVIVGFPGETAANFTETCDVVQTVGFSKIHVFPFSARRGTPAAEMPGQISKPEKADRVSRLMEIERTLREHYFRKLVGRRLQVLVETEPGDSQFQAGTSCRYAPVRFPSTPLTRRSLGEITAVEITSSVGDKLLGIRCGD